MIGNVAAVALAYLIGAIPIGVLLGRALKGVDVRDYGSGKMGTANVTRTLGVKTGIFCLLVDMGKGVVAVFIARSMGDAVYVEALAAAAAVGGHNWSVFINFSGGRGVSTGLGALFAMVPLLATASLGAGLLIILLTRYVSAGSMMGALFAVAVTCVMAAVGREPWEYFAYAVVVGSAIIWQHRENIWRLLKGEERRVTQEASKRSAGS